MVPTLFFSQLGLVALGCIFLRLCWLWPNAATSPQQPIVPPTPARRKRSTAPTPGAGLPQRPPCALWERAATPAPAPPLAPPEPRPPTPRQPRPVETSQPFCPQGGWRSRGWGGRGHWRANGPPSGGPWRQCHGPSCDGSLLAPPGTLFHGQPAAVAFLGRVLACLAAALLCDLHLEPLPLDAFDPARRERKAGAISDEEAMQRLERSPDWGWTVRDPQSTRLVGGDGGRRTLALAPRVVPQVPAGLAPGWVSLFGPDGRKA
jgi:hypothetical protein